MKDCARMVIGTRASEGAALLLLPLAATERVHATGATLGGIGDEQTAAVACGCKVDPATDSKLPARDPVEPRVCAACPGDR